MDLFIWICIIVFFSGFIKGLSGFGGILVALPLLVLFIDIKTVVPLTILLSTSGTIFLLITLFRHFEWRESFPILIGCIPGLLIGVFFLKTLDKNILQLFLAIFLICYSFYSLFFGTIKSILRDGWGYFFGFIAGLLGAAIGAGGQPIIIYTSLKPWNKDKIKVIQQGFFLVSGLIRIFLYGFAGIITTNVLHLYALSLPTFFLGVYIGTFFYGKINETFYKKTIFILLGFLGIFIILKILKTL